jgi:hypothetical protein
MDRIRRTSISLSAAVAILCVSGCSLFAGRAEPSPEAAAQAERIGVYEAAPPGSKDYRFVTRLWVEPWKSAASYPRYASVEAGVADLRAQAVALGGDAIVNFGCYHADVDPRSDYYCNGTVVRFVP